MKVLSLFDGISCGRVALERANIPVERYVAYEIEKTAIKIAQKNYPDIEEKGDVFKADFHDYKGFDMLIGGSPCFIAGTQVLTINGYKNIEDLEVGDLVYTHNDRYRPITAVGSKEADVWSVKSQGTEDFIVTENHPFYVRNMKRTGHFSKRTFAEPSWKEVKDLKKGDFMASPIIQTEENPDNLTEEDCWLIGRYIADGHIRHDKRSDRKNSSHYGVVYSIGDKKLDDFKAHVKSYHMSCYPHSQSVHRCVISSKEWVERIENYSIGKNCYEKTVPNIILNLPKNLCKAVVEGYVSGDGHFDNATGQWCACTVSKSLAYSMALLVQKVYGVNCGVKAVSPRKKEHHICGRLVKPNPQWAIMFRTIMKSQSVAKVIDTKIYTPFKSKSYVGKDIVYNISVEDDESYIANNRVVHNCTYWSIAQKAESRETTNSGLGWDLFSQYIRALKESEVPYFLYENNYSMDKNIKAEITKAFNEVMQWRKENLSKDSEAYKAACNYDKIEPVHINSGLVSAQSRDRYYWTNIPCNGIEYMPEDKGIKLQDILEYGYADREKGLCCARRYAGFQGTESYQCRRYFGKSFGQAVFSSKEARDEVKALWKADPYFDKGVPVEKDLTKRRIRQLTLTEVERFQTLPDGYTDGADVSDAMRIEAIGNGWTVDVIAHLMRGFERVNQPKHFKFGI